MNKNFKQLSPAYGYADVAIVPGDITINPDLVNTSVKFADLELEIPILASAMDSVVSPQFAAALSARGGLAVLNLEGIHTRYGDTTIVYEQIAAASADEATALLQRIYSAPIREDLIGHRIEEIKQNKGVAAVSVVPANAKRLTPIAAEAGAEVIIIQSTVTTARHSSRSPRGLILSELKRSVGKPIVVGNTVSYDVTLELMEQGVDGVLVGVGPGAACTSREVLGVGVPQITATIECAAARDAYMKNTGRYVPIVTDGGIRTGGDLCKSFVAGADLVMIGSPFAGTYEAPGMGYHWGMAAPHHSLPRGTRLSIGQNYTLDQLLFGPTTKTDGTENLLSALRISMGMVGAANLRDMYNAELVYAPAIKSEGKIYQMKGMYS